MMPRIEDEEIDDRETIIVMYKQVLSAEILIMYHIQISLILGEYIFSAADSVADEGIDLAYLRPAAFIAIVTTVIATLLCRHGKVSKKQAVALPLLIIYIFLVFASTVFSRTPMGGYCYELVPFWSYREIVRTAGDSGVPFWRIDLFWEDILNVFMLMPEGVLLSVVLNTDKCNDKHQSQPFEINKYTRATGRFCQVALLGFLTSLSIELLQLVLKRGLFEFDDMFHNTLGVIIGYGIWWIFSAERRGR
jgi:glycopeptide antibiotics resistance protein